MVEKVLCVLQTSAPVVEGWATATFWNNYCYCVAIGLNACQWWTHSSICVTGIPVIPQPLLFNLIDDVCDYWRNDPDRPVIVFPNLLLNY